MFPLPLGETGNLNSTQYDDRVKEITDPTISFYGTVWVPCVWIAFFLETFTVLSCLAFEKQRKFPTCFGIYMCFVDLTHIMRELVKGSPIPSVSENWYWTPSQAHCKILYVWLSWVEAGEVFMPFALSFVIYLSVVRKIDLSYNCDKRYFWSFIGLYFIYSIGYCIIIFACIYDDKFDKKPNVISCYISSPDYAPNYVSFIQWILLAAIESFFLIKSAKYIWAVVRNVRHSRTLRAQTNTAWLIIRLLVLIFIQTVPRAVVNIYYLYLAWAFNHNGGKKSVKYAFATLSIFFIIFSWFANCAVVLWGNKSFIAWCKKSILQMPSTSSTEDVTMVPKTNSLMSDESGGSPHNSGTTSTPTMIAMELMPSMLK